MSGGHSETLASSRIRLVVGGTLIWKNDVREDDISVGGSLSLSLYAGAVRSS